MPARYVVRLSSKGDPLLLTPFAVDSVFCSFVTFLGGLAFGSAISMGTSIWVTKPIVLAYGMARDT